MKKLRLHTLAFFKFHLPLVAVIVVGLIIAFQNISLQKSYAGWDNILAEFNVGRYARQVFFGAWLEHMGLGGPAAQGHLSEVPRLPILFLLKALLPDNLIRYTYIFTMYLLGGVGMYLYLAKCWIHTPARHLKAWLAGLGALLYLLHILTLQQFYISFEMFMAQFAFLPFVLLTIHALSKEMSAKTTLVFIAVQLLIAPSGHTPTIFYLATLFTLLYSFAINQKKHLLDSLRFSFIVGFLTFFANAYWIIPNAYYTLHNAHYVQESHDNQLFAPESIWSIRESSTLSNFLSGTHYLFTWKDYSFSKHHFELIFNEWLQHLSQPYVIAIMQTIGITTVMGMIIAFVDKQKGGKRFAVVATYLICVALIWIDLFPTKFIIDTLYESKSFTEAFRNPFTKLSILYSFVSVLLFVEALELFSLHLGKSKYIFFVACALIIACPAWPSFQGHFISEKLQVAYPDVYQDLFSYMNTRDRNLRVLQLPQLSHAGWEYYDWQHMSADNGYQGMGFYFFGLTQPALNRDFDRWVETSDFFYHELKYALGSQNTEQFKDILTKYNVDIVIVDETRIDPNRTHDFAFDHRLAQAAGMEKVWSKEFITVYERKNSQGESEILVPDQLAEVSANTSRVRTDYVYATHGDYIPQAASATTYPFSQLVATNLDTVTFSDNEVAVTQRVVPDDYVVIVPGINEETYRTPAAISYQDKTVTIRFPATAITIGEKRVALPRLANSEFTTKEASEKIVVFFDTFGVVVDQGKTVYPILNLLPEGDIEVGYAPVENEPIDPSKLTVLEATTLEPNWESFKQFTVLTGGTFDSITATSEFPTLALPFTQNPSVNCASPPQGSIGTTTQGSTTLYEAHQFGVNCNGYNLEYMSSSYGYLMRVVGKNLLGRGIKFFINHENPVIQPEDYILSEDAFDTVFNLPTISTDPTIKYALNWEVRSLGKTSRAELESITIAPFPTEQLAQLTLRSDIPELKYNNLTILSDHFLLDSVHLVTYKCYRGECYLGLDQTYDDLWLAFIPSQRVLLPHDRLNNWANLWTIPSGTHQVVLVYVPELISLTAMSVLGVTILILVVRVLLHRSKRSHSL